MSYSLFCCDVCDDYTDCPGQNNCNVVRAYRRDTKDWMEGYHDLIETKKSDCRDDSGSDNEDVRQGQIHLHSVA